MNGRALYTYNSDLKLQEVIDASANAMAENIEIAYGTDSMSAAPEIPATLREVMKHFLIYGNLILVKHPPVAPATEVRFSVMHTDFDDVKINMEPTPRMTITRYIPATKKTESVVLGEEHFRVYRGGLTDISLQDLLVFLGYTFA